MSELQSAILAMCGSDDGATAEAGHRLLDLYDTFELKLRQQLSEQGNEIFFLREQVAGNEQKLATATDFISGANKEIEKLRQQLEAAQGENERLQSIIKKAQEQEPVAITCFPDPEDEREGVRFSLKDWQKLNDLRSNTKLYTLPPIPADHSEDGPKVQVWYGRMPESNGKSNWTVILHTGDISSGHTIQVSEYPDRARFEADELRFLIGELKERPDILTYDSDKISAPFEWEAQSEVKPS